MIAHLGDDLQKAFPGESGFSRTNVYQMRALFLAYRGTEKIDPQLVGQVSETGLPLAMEELPWGPLRDYRHHTEPRSLGEPPSSSTA